MIEFPRSSSVGEVEGGQLRVLNKRADNVDKCNPRISDARAHREGVDQPLSYSRRRWLRQVTPRSHD